MSVQNQFSITELSNHFIDYLGYRLDIISNNPRWWLGKPKYNLPTFENYLQNCVLDKNGCYDFTKRNYLSQREEISFTTKNSIIKQETKIQIQIRYSIYMGTPFNFEKQVLIN